MSSGHQFPYGVGDVRVGANVLDQNVVDRCPDVQAAEVSDLQRAAGGEAEPDAATNCGVDVFRAGDALVEQVPYLPDQRRTLRDGLR